MESPGGKVSVESLSRSVGLWAGLGGIALLLLRWDDPAHYGWHRSLGSDLGLSESGESRLRISGVDVM